MWSRRFLNVSFLRPLVWALLRVQVSGREHIPAKGPFILMVNHCNFLDPGVAIWAMLPREVVMFTKAQNLNLPVGGLMLRMYGVIPVERGEADVAAMRRALEVLDKDRDILLVAPEGTRSYHGRLLPAKDGMAFIATRAEVSILPVGVSGVRDFWSNVKRLKPTHVRVTIGHPFRFRYSGRPRKEILYAMTREAMYQLASLLPPQQWGAYADIENASEEYLEFLEPGHSNLTYAGSIAPPGEGSRQGRLAGVPE
jgi:1-acyl-sn-glycerol-3-phosphate acyltransferase